MRDASAKGHLRVPRPTRQKLTTEDLVDIDRLLASGTKKTHIAEAFGISKTWVSLYAKGLRRQYDRPNAAKRGAA